MSLAPPEEPQHNIEDPGAHELQDSSDDHFSDADEHKNTYPPMSPTNPPMSPMEPPMSPIPMTRVERVDDVPAHGEVPGTPAFKIRSQDAVPDEVEIIPDGQPGPRSRSSSRLSESDRPSTPGGTPIPKMIVERVDDKLAHGEVPGTAAYDMRRADAEPDEVVQAPEETRMPLELEDRSHSPAQAAHQPSPLPISIEPATAPSTASAGYDEFDDGHNKNSLEKEPELEPAEADDDDFGDDFDDFGDVAEAGQDDDDDFGDVDDGFQEPEPVAVSAPPPPQPEPVQDPLAHLPNLTFASLQSPQDILKTISPHLHEIFPEIDNHSDLVLSQTQSTPNNPILTDRSASLWSQLVAPPPLQPPNWIRSRIRRLFLVSLGVPVDLDEILPASKQKKLILPNINLHPSENAEGTPRGSISRLRKEGTNGSSTSIASGTTGTEAAKAKKKKELERRGPAPPPEFDANTAGLVAGTTEAAMTGFSDEELKAHVERLEELIASASEALEYWLKRKDSAVGDKEAFEGVIENLVGFVRKNRDNRMFK